MSQWDFLIGESTIASVLPVEYARYREPIRRGLIVFLDGLTPARQAAILDDQARLPFDASGFQRLAALARSCPALHKLGQVVARDRRVDPELRTHLQELESLPPTVPLEALQAILDRELGPLDALGLRLDPPALAEASVAIVVPFVHKTDGPSGVFKILKPEIEPRLEEELRLLTAVGADLDQRCQEFQIPPLDYADAFEQVRDKLRQEIRLDLEQTHLRRARAFYADDPRVVIPEPFDFSTPRVTAMTRVHGTKITEPRHATPDQRRALAGLVASALVARPILAKEDQALFHGDPHAGNLFLTDDHRLALLDWSLVGMLQARDRAAIVQVLLNAVTLDTYGVMNILENLSERQPVDRPALERVVRDRLRRLRRGEFPGFSWLMGLLDEAVQSARLRVGADLMLFRKSLLTLEGVLADIGDARDPVQSSLQGAFLRQLAAEWPRRWLSPLASRDFATRLSNADLVTLALSGPFVAARYWLDEGLDLLETLKS